MEHSEVSQKIAGCAIKEKPPRHRWAERDIDILVHLKSARRIAVKVVNHLGEKVLRVI